MTTLRNWISQACNALGLQADLDFVVDVGSGREIRPVARIRNHGAKNGMLVVRNYDDVRPYADGLVQAGYGYSALDEPRAWRGVRSGIVQRDVRRLGMVRN